MIIPKAQSLRIRKEGKRVTDADSVSRLNSFVVEFRQIISTLL